MFKAIYSKFNKIKNKKSLERYAYELPYYIAREYGVNETYKTEQIESVISKYKFSPKYNYYGHSMFCTKETFEKLFGDIMTVPSFSQCREEISEILSIGTNNFTYYDLITRSRFSRCVTITTSDSGQYEYQISDRMPIAGGGNDPSIS